MAVAAAQVSRQDPMNAAVLPRRGRFVGGTPKLSTWKATRQIPATSPESEALSKDLKQRGFSFVGPTVAYAYMQAAGLVNDHLVSCFRYQQILTEVANAN